MHYPQPNGTTITTLPFVVRGYYRGVLVDEVFFADMADAEHFVVWVHANYDPAKWSWQFSKLTFRFGPRTDKEVKRNG